MDSLRIGKVGCDIEYSAVLGLRYEVFVVEQGVAEELERDELDCVAVHFFAMTDGETVGCGRVVIEGENAHIGRVAVKASYRGLGIGKRLCLKMLEYAEEQGCGLVYLNSQLTAAGFYEKLGFGRVGEIFPDAGIAHIRMEYRP